MKVLKYNKPYAVRRTTIEDGKRLDNPLPQYYGRFSTITTKFGFVTISELDWKHNNGKTFCTFFEAIINGYKYTASLDEAKLSDIRLKWMATHFIKNIPFEFLKCAFE